MQKIANVFIRAVFLVPFCQVADLFKFCKSILVKFLRELGQELRKNLVDFGIDKNADSG